MNIMKMLIFVEHVLGFDFPNPPSEEQRRHNRKKMVKRIVSNLSHENFSLQNGRYVMEEDIESLRYKNQKHDFCS
jgi:hypothetical protein